MNDYYEKVNWTYCDEKYFYLYKHVDATEGSLCIIKDSTLKFTSPKNFNDPFDCLFDIECDYVSTASLYEEVRSYTKKIGVKLSDREMKVMAEEMHLHLNQNPQILKEQQKEIRDKAYICSLNDNPLNLLMWSHYAQQHKGFLIEFKFSMNQLLENTDSFNHFSPLPINYNGKYPTLEKNDRGTDNISIKAYLSKSEDWLYEREWRVIRYGLKGVSEIQKYPRDLVLSSVVAGVSCDDKQFLKWNNELQRLSKNVGRSIKIYRAQMIDKEYKLTVPNHPRLDLSGK